MLVYLFVCDGIAVCQMFYDACMRERARVRVYMCVCVVHWHCSAQLSMFNMEKRYRNKIIIIINLRLENVAQSTHFPLEFSGGEEVRGAIGIWFQPRK